jgi:hypothetical protein
MEEYLYAIVKKNWRYVHPLNKIFSVVDYFIETNSRKINNTPLVRKIRFKLKERWKIRNWFLVHRNTIAKNRHWYE